MKKCIATVLLAVMLCLVACGDKETPVTVNTSEKEGMITLYYPSGNTIVGKEEKYQVRQPDSLSAAVEEVMTALMVDWNSAMVYNTYMLDADNNLSLEFILNDQFLVEESVLMDAAICQTLFQIKDINSITVQLVNEDEVELSSSKYTRDSFYYYDQDSSDYNNRYIRLFYPDVEGTNITSSEVKLHQETDISLVEQVVNLLITRDVLPDKTKVNSVSIMGDVCYLDFNASFEKDKLQYASDLVLKSLTNSITSIPGISGLRILVAGKPIDEFHGIKDVSSVLRFYNAE